MDFEGGADHILNCGCFYSAVNSGFKIINLTWTYMTYCQRGVSEVSLRKTTCCRVYDLDAALCWPGVPTYVGQRPIQVEQSLHVNEKTIIECDDVSFILFNIFYDVMKRSSSFLSTRPIKVSNLENWCWTILHGPTCHLQCSHCQLNWKIFKRLCDKIMQRGKFQEPSQILGCRDGSALKLKKPIRDVCWNRFRIERIQCKWFMPSIVCHTLGWDIQYYLQVG